eukprot:6181525-Pleurochrysis_carterae.AAC.1
MADCISHRIIRCVRARTTRERGQGGRGEGARPVASVSPLSRARAWVQAAAARTDRRRSSRTFRFCRSRRPGVLGDDTLTTCRNEQVYELDALMTQNRFSN